MKNVILKYQIAFLLIGIWTCHLNGQISFIEELGYNNYSFTEVEAGGNSLNLENALEGLYFGIRVEKKLNQNISVGVIAHYSTVKHDVDSDAPPSNPIVGYQYGIIDLIPVINYSIYRGIRIGLGPLIQSQINKKYTTVYHLDTNKSGKRNLGFLFLLGTEYKKTGISLMYKQLISLPEDSIFQYSKFSGIRVGITYKLAEVFNKK